MDIALAFIASYGLVAMFILLVLDGAMLLPVFPGEIVLIMAVTAYATDPGSLMMLIVVATAAGLLGSLILYGICRGGGRALVERYPRLFMMPKKRREKLERTFQRPVGQSLVMFLRVVPLTRILVNIPAGLARMPFVRFVVLSTIGLAVYHAGFLWFTYEVGREGSKVETQADQLQAAYASPAWEYVEANSILAGIAVLLIGAALSVMTSIKMRQDPEETTGSLIGMAARLILFWGGIALAVFTYMDPDMVYSLSELYGLDVKDTAATVGIAPVQLLIAVAATSTLLGFAVGRANAAARRARKRHKVQKKRIEEARMGRPVQQWVPREPGPPVSARQPSQGDAPRPEPSRDPARPPGSVPPRDRRPPHDEK